MAIVSEVRRAIKFKDRLVDEQAEYKKRASRTGELITRSNLKMLKNPNTIMKTNHRHRKFAIDRRS